MMYQRWPIHCNKRNTLLWGVDSGVGRWVGEAVRGGGRECMGNSVLSAHFCCEFNTPFKKLSLFLKKLLIQECFLKNDKEYASEQETQYLIRITESHLTKYLLSLILLSFERSWLIHWYVTKMRLLEKRTWIIMILKMITSTRTLKERNWKKIVEINKNRKYNDQTQGPYNSISSFDNSKDNIHIKWAHVAR